MIPRKYMPLASGTGNRAAIAVSARFVADLWDYEPDACTFLATRIDGTWREHPIQGRNRLQKVEEVLADHRPDLYDIYFCPNAFTEPTRRAQFALPSRYAWCDIDGNDVALYAPAPNAVWETSPGRHQGLWIWDRKIAPGEAEAYSRSLVYTYGGDKNGWSITKMLRLPGTINHKPVYSKPTVQLRKFDQELQGCPTSLSGTCPSSRKLRMFLAPLGMGECEAQDVIKRYRRKVSLFARSLMTSNRVIYPDRSEAIFVIVSELVLACARDAEIATVLLANPYFLEKHGSNEAIAQREIVSIRDKVEAGR